MTIIALLVLVFALFALSRVLLRYKDKQMGTFSLVFWLIIWSGIILFTLKPQLSERISNFLGIEKGTDALFFISIVALFYSVFRIYIKLNKLDQDITNLTINISKHTHIIEKKINDKAKNKKST